MLQDNKKYCIVKRQTNINTAHHVKENKNEKKKKKRKKGGYRIFVPFLFWIIRLPSAGRENMFIPLVP